MKSYEYLLLFSYAVSPFYSLILRIVLLQNYQFLPFLPFYPPSSLISLPSNPSHSALILRLIVSLSLIIVTFCFWRLRDFRADYIILNNQLEVSSVGKVNSYSLSSHQLPLILCLGVILMLLYPFVIIIYICIVVHVLFIKLFLRETVFLQIQ